MGPRPWLVPVYYSTLYGIPARATNNNQSKDKGKKEEASEDVFDFDEDDDDLF